ncbi:Mtor, partial [Symbiodinium microadriaticum]
MTIVGTDGLEYRFLLKGHEDLRQDERVMQLFGLINVCLDNDRWTRSRGLNIVRYSVLPLSNNSGVIGWVENCDTLNALVKQYREARDVKMSVEHKLLVTKAPCYEKLTVQQKVDVFSQVRQETTGCDLAKMLWLKSKTSDVWVERRSNYTKSLAVMSIVGYILGLGDRHPSNLMLDRVAGRIVHIDFGDCFEVAMQRSKYPETVPFRLTRMLVKAMEISGIEGTFRSTSEKVRPECNEQLQVLWLAYVMRILRDNQNSVMAMLEAFVYDPLISWRLLAQDANESSKVSQTDGTDHVQAAVAAIKSIDAGSAASSPAVDNDQANSVNVDRLIREATSEENLCQLFVGWCPF